MDPDPNPTSIIWKLVLLFVLILVNAFFAMSEIAIITLNDNKIKAMAEDGHKGAKRVLSLTKNPSGFLSSIQIGITLAGFLTSASAADSFSGPLANWIYSFSWAKFWNVSVWQGISLVLVTIIISYFSLVLGELVPKRIGMQAAEKISFKIAPVLLFVKSCFKPFIAFLTVSTNLVVRMLGFDPNASEENVTEEEILMMVDAGEEKGVIEESQKEMINNIFEFDDIVAADVMTHRTEIEAVEIHEPLADIVKLAIDEGYSRIPVYKEELDNIVGILYVKDLLKYVGNDVPKSFKISNIMRPAVFVPESKKCGDLFEELTEKRLQLAIVVDEYGGTAGLITMEDLIESILGNIQDEYDDEEEDIEQLSDTVFTIDGVTDLDEVEDELDRELPKGDYDTLAGMIISHLGYIPSEEETPSVEVNHILFTVLTVEDRRIEKVRVEKLPLPEKDEEEEEDD